VLLTESGSFTYTFTQTAGISAGSNYRYKYRAKNAHGWGSFSPIVTIMAAAVPDQLAAVTTSLSGTGVQFTWAVTPNDHGSPVTEYRVKFKQFDSSYVLNPTDCDASTNPVFTDLKCTVPMATFTSTYGLSVGDLIIASVEAMNAKGYSTPSADNGSGPTAKTVPSPPTPQRGGATSKTQVEVTWAAVSGSPQDGGSAVTDYKVYWDQGSGSWTQAAATTSGATSYI